MEHGLIAGGVDTTPKQRRDFVLEPAESTGTIGILESAISRAEREDNVDRAERELAPVRSQTIALCMIVRDEAAVLERCLASVRGLIDTWIVCDTGSRDNTPELVVGLLGDLPGQLHHRPWRDFGWNRSELMALAAGAADYLLLLDADMTLCLEAPLPPLSADAYLVRHAGSLDYAVPRLVRGDRRWWFEGSTHEYLATDGAPTQEVLSALSVEHHGDGAHRAEKSQRDVRLLERDLQHDPSNARAVFYLAQTYCDIGEHDRAIELYLRRAELGGWDEEVFYALYQAGALLGRREAGAGLPILLSAWQQQPTRAEALHELARICRFAGWSAAARAFAERGLEIPYPEAGLFVHRWIYEWGLRYEFALAAFDTGDVEAALAVADELLGIPDLPSDIAGYLHERCRQFGDSSSRRPRIQVVAPSAEFAEIRLDVLPAWPAFNPTIAADGEGFRLIVRTANYRIENGRYIHLTDDPVIQTQNYLLKLDQQLEVTDLAPLLERDEGPARCSSRIQGYEDCRLIQLDGDWLASATVRDRNPDERCEIALLKLDGSEIDAVTLLGSPTPGRHEKNWMPFLRERTLCFLYSCNPTVVLSCDRITGVTEVISQLPGPSGAGWLRGGSQGVATDDGTLFVVHEVVEVDGARSYPHRLVLLDDDGRLAGVSRRFTFLGADIEFCAGLTRRHNDLLFTFGVGDHSARLAIMPTAAALNLLETVPARR
jgi:glycosyltransferase involved in cell wall biosynthesis/predicted GH43/DUF377 family glycosyl hydrolase